MKARFSKRSILLMLSASAFCAALLGCQTPVGYNYAGGDYTPPAEPTVKSLIQNKSGDVWLDRWGPGDRDGFILNSDGSVTFVTDEWNGSIHRREVGRGKWDISGSALVFTGVTGSGVYAVSAPVSSANQYSSTMTLDLGDENGNLVKVSFDRVPESKLKVKLGKRPDQDGGKPVKRSISLAP
jgi:hypothetical protein